MTEEDLAGFAIVGMSGRFPGAADTRAFWTMLREGRHGVTRFRTDELEDGFDARTRADPDYVPARPILTDVEMFDAEFFGMTPREAALTDPQQRVFLECAWQALEDAGCDPQRFKGLIGVFAGSSLNSYFLRHVCPDRASVERFTSEFQVGSYAELLGTLHDFVATRVSYKLDLRGPAVAVQSACSTSLLAVAQACQSLAFFQSDLVLAGGVSITLPQRRGYLHQDGGMVSPDGTCRPFDANAAGTVFGSGAGVVALKRLADAVADGDTIHAVIKGFGVNNDGAGKVGFTAPSVDGQASCIAASLAMAGIDAATIGYVECHGTATPLGDPIEIEGLARAFEQMATEAGDCVLGSAKANVGHLDAAAGVTGLIKTAMILRTGEIPPQIHYDAPNPRLDLARRGFRIARDGETWRRAGGPRRAGVSAFGVGGTNVHLTLEQAPPLPVAMDEPVRPVVLALSARDDEALAAMPGRLADALERLATDQPDATLADVARTLRDGRRAFGRRLTIAATTVEDAATRLRSLRPTATRAEPTPAIVFLFPGQGSQYPGMCAALYDADEGFRKDVDDGARHLEPLLGCDIRKHLLDTTPHDDDTPHPIRSTVLAQPALFLVEHALARLIERLGVTADAMIGHSLGELVAACLAGVISYEDALTLVAWRGKLMQGQPPGAMLSIRMGADALQPLLPQGAEIAASNAPALSVAAGPFAAIEALEAVLSARGVACRRLHTSHAFHSAMIEPVVEPLVEAIAGITLNPPSRRVVSCVDGTWLTAEQATSHRYWARHCRARVDFAAGLATALDRSLAPDRELVLVEIGPGRTLSTFAEMAIGRTRCRSIVQTVPEFADREETEIVLAEALGRLWESGLPIDLVGIGPRGRRQVPLPTYPFQKKRHWIERPAEANPAEPVVRPVAEMGANRTGPADVQLTMMPTVSTNGAEGWNLTMETQQAIAGILEDLLGQTVGPEHFGATFVSLGCDSLLLGQFAQRLNKQFGVKITFRQLMRDLGTVEVVAGHMQANAPADKLPTRPAAAAPVAAPVGGAAAAPTPAVAAAPFAMAAPGSVVLSGGTPLEAVMRDQIAAMQGLFAAQLAAMGGGGLMPAATTAPVQTAAASVAPMPADTAAASDAEPPSRFRMYKPGADGSDVELTDRQRRFIDDLVGRYAAKSPGSKARTQATRRVLADPRSVSGFRQLWKELVYPLVCQRSKGAYITDVDGNDYVDLVNGYGQTMFGHAPDFVIEAVERQLRDGFAIGPQTPLAGEVAEMIARMTGNERIAFCNTGSEAVMAAMRLARAVTGRQRVVVFGGGYHGQFDEVLVKGRPRSAQPGAMPIAPGIPAESVGSMVVLPNASPESLAFIRANADDLAAVVVEPVQSRHPDLQPREFLAELRAITAQSGTALVFDEVVTGFRVHPGGMQAVFDIRADLATYGKVLGGGMPIGVVAGRTEFMDALDGGHWQFGDDSQPEVAPTFFAGTFVRHPLVLAAAKAVLEHIDRAGPALYETVGGRTKELVGAINADLSRRGTALRAEQFASWFYLDASREGPLASLLFPQLRLLGINVQEGFPCFLTTEHGEAEVSAIRTAFGEALDALQAGEIIAGGTVQARLTPPPPANDSVPDASVPLPDVVPMTEPQREIFLAAQMGDAASMVFNESVSLAFDGPIDVAAMAAALDDVVARHDALRARVKIGEQALHIVPKLELDVPVADLTQTAATADRLAELIAEDARTPFDLAEGPLVRAFIARLPGDRTTVVFTAHHIICDGWSMNVIIGDLAALYRSRTSGEAPDLAEPLPFRRYALDRQTVDGARNSKFWRGLFAEAPVPLELPSDRPRPEIRSFSGTTLRETLDADLVSALTALARSRGVTLFSVLFAGVQATFQRLAGEGEAILTVPMAGQSLLDGDDVEGRDLVGHCVNFLPIRAPIDPAAPFAAHLAVADKRLADALDHQDYTFGTLVRELDLPRTPNRVPLSDIQFNLERLGAGADFGPLAVDVRTNAKAFVNFDLFVNMIQRERDIVVEVDYSTDLYDGTTISRWIGHLRQLLAHAGRLPETPVGELQLLDADAVRWLRDDLNASAAAFPADRLVHELIEMQVDQAPDRIAGHCGGESLTYADVERRANRLANHIRAVAPGEGQRIALAVPRSFDMLVALLAILKSGNAYVPLDPAHPTDRLRQTLDLADCAAVLTVDGAVAEAVPPGVLLIDIAQEAEAIAAASPVRLSRPAEADPTAHVIFTSGSTGAPKGVEIGHRAVVNLVSSVLGEPGFAADDSIVAVTTVSFDIALAELLLPLVCGGSTHIATRAEMADPFALAGLMRSSNATVLQATPSLWRVLLDTGFKPEPGTRVISTGEPLPRDLARALCEAGVDLWNMYGPTETTIWSSKARVTDPSAPIVIGRPIGNTELHVLDPFGNICPVGVSGELHIGGEGLAKGYFRRPDLTDSAFVRLSVAGSEPRRLYRTGDVALRRPDGSLLHLGRRDHQVKVRGFRIELEEVESTLRSAPGVADAAVAVRNAGTAEAALAAFYVALPGHWVDPVALKQHAARLLPHFMVASEWHEVAALPRTANGKLDRKRILGLTPLVPNVTAAPEAAPKAVVDTLPRVAEATDSVTLRISAILEDVLGRQGIRSEDRLFDLGAHSLHIFRIVARLHEQDLPIEARHLMTNPSVAELTALAHKPANDQTARARGPALSAFKRSARERQARP